MEAKSKGAFDPSADPFSAGFVYPPCANFNGPSAVNSTSLPNPVVFEPIRPRIFFPGYPQQASGPGLEPSGRSSLSRRPFVGAASGAQHWDCADSCSLFSRDFCAHPEEH